MYILTIGEEIYKPPPTNMNKSISKPPPSLTVPESTNRDSINTYESSKLAREIKSQIQSMKMKSTKELPVDVDKELGGKISTTNGTL